MPTLPQRTLAKSSDPGIQHAVNELTVFENAAPQHTFPDKPAFFEDPHGCGVPLEHRCFETCNLEVLESIV